MPLLESFVEYDYIFSLRLAHIGVLFMKNVVARLEINELLYQNFVPEDMFV